MKSRLVALVLLTVAAGWLRFTSTSFGLPDKYRPDEEYLVSRALGFHNDLNPHFAVYPAVQMYLQHVLLRAVAAVEGQRGDFRGAFHEGGGARAHLMGRQLSAAFGTATVPAIYWAIAPAYGPAAALASAAIVAFSTIHVRESKYATTDIGAVFWLTLAIGMMLRVILRGGYRHSLAAGALAGLAIGTKYPAGAIMAGLAVAHVGARWQEGRTIWRSFRDIRPYLALFAAVVVFLATNPYLLLDWAQTERDFEYQRGFLAQGVGNERAGWGWMWLLERALPDGLGPELAIFLIVAVIWGVLRPRIGSLSLLAFLAVACVGMTTSRYTFYRYIVIVLPAVAIFGGLLVSDVRDLLLRRLPARWATALVTASVCLLLVPSLIRDYKLNRLLGRRDTRTIAREWIEENVPRGSVIAMTHHATPYGKPQLAHGYANAPLDDPATLRERGIRWILSDSSLLEFYSPGPTEEQLRALESEATLRLDVDPRKPGTPEPIFDEADAFYVPLRHASSVKRPGPRIRIWELRG